jgi:hypothetical protein
MKPRKTGPFDNQMFSPNKRLAQGRKSNGKIIPVVVLPASIPLECVSAALRVITNVAPLSSIDPVKVRLRGKSSNRVR